MVFRLFFFFQAEDGIRDLYVTGVQTCALPISQVIAVLLTAIAALFAIGCGGWLVVWGFGGIAQWVIANATRLQGLYMHAADLLEQRGLYAAELFAQQVNVLWLVQILR